MRECGPGSNFNPIRDALVVVVVVVIEIQFPYNLGALEQFSATVSNMVPIYIMADKCLQLKLGSIMHQCDWFRCKFSA